MTLNISRHRNFAKNLANNIIQMLEAQILQLLKITKIPEFVN